MADAPLLLLLPPRRQLPVIRKRAPPQIVKSSFGTCKARCAWRSPKARPVIQPQGHTYTRRRPHNGPAAVLDGVPRDAAAGGRPRGHCYRCSQVVVVLLLLLPQALVTPPRRVGALLRPAACRGCCRVLFDWSVPRVGSGPHFSWRPFPFRAWVAGPIGRRRTKGPMLLLRWSGWSLLLLLRMGQEILGPHSSGLLGCCWGEGERRRRGVG